MFIKFQSFLSAIDLIGIKPQLYIFNNDKYKSFLSSIISFIILLFSIPFVFYSLNEYLKYQNPFVIYSKANDINTGRSIPLKQLFLMFQIVEPTMFSTINKSIAFYEAEYSAIYDNGTYNYIPLEIENCNIDKSPNSYYKEFIFNREGFGKSISDFYCINYKRDDLELFYYPNIGYSSINLFPKIIKNSNYTPENLQSLIVSENDLIDHNNKGNPINKYLIYHLPSGYSSSEFTTINFNFQYIKYETDDGPIFKNSKISKGISFSDMTFSKNIKNSYNLQNNFINSNNSTIGKIIIEMSKSHFDNYKRTYSRLQSLLAEIMSVINLLFEVGRQIVIFLCQKKMSKDIMRNLLDKNKIHKKYIKNNNIVRLNKSFEPLKLVSSQRNITMKETINKSNNTNLAKSFDKLNLSKNYLKKDKNSSISINKVFEELNYISIFKSFLCFKDKKTKLINLCHNFIIEDISIEKILKRFYNLENYCKLYKKDEKYNNFKHAKFKLINKYISDINNQIEIEVNLKDKKIDAI